MTRIRTILKLAGTLVLVAALAAGCASRNPKGVADVPECRALAENAPRFSFDVGIDYLRRQADAYSECMIGRGYALNDAAVQSNLERFEMIKNADVMGGDPAPQLAVRRQKLRMNPEFWLTTTAPRA